MKDNYNPRVDLEYAAASKRWATVGILIVSLVAVIGVWFFTETYYGADGVRVLGIGIAIVAIVVIVVGIGFAINAVTAGLFMRLFIGVLNGLVRHEEADDRGEIARSLVGVAKVSKQMERDVLRGSIQMGRQYGNAIVQAQRGDDRRARMEQRANEIDAFYNTHPQFDVDVDAADTDERIPEGW